MKDRFDFLRFTHVMWYTFVSQPLIPYVAALAAVPLMYAVFAMELNPGTNSFYGTTPLTAFAMYFIICGWLYAGMIFHEFRKKTAAGEYLMLPASQLEKWLSKALLAFIVFPALLIMFFKLAMYGFGFISAPLFAFRYPPFDWSVTEVKIIVFIFYMVMPAAFIISLLWRRFSILKGIALAFALLLSLFFSINRLLPNTSFEGTTTALINVVTPVFLKQECTGDACTLVWWFWMLSTYIPALLLFTSSWFLLKSKEI